jgi:hypothetical protein
MLLIVHPELYKGPFHKMDSSTPQHSATYRCNRAFRIFHLPVCGEATCIGITLLFEGLWIHVNQLPASLSLPLCQEPSVPSGATASLLLLDQRFVAIECYQASLIESFDQAGGACKITRVFDRYAPSLLSARLGSPGSLSGVQPLDSFRGNDPDLDKPFGWSLLTFSIWYPEDSHASFIYTLGETLRSPHRRYIRGAGRDGRADDVDAGSSPHARCICAYSVLGYR